MLVLVVCVCWCRLLILGVRPILPAFHVCCAWQRAWFARAAKSSLRKQAVAKSICGRSEAERLLVMHTPFSYFLHANYAGLSGQGAGGSAKAGAGGGDRGDEEEEEEAEEAGAQLAEYGLDWQVISLLLEAGGCPAAPKGVSGIGFLAKRSWPSTASTGRSSACCWRPLGALPHPKGF